MISNGDATILLSAIILDKKIYKLTRERLDDPIFDPGSQYVHDFLFKQYMEISDEAGEPVSLGMLSNRLGDAISAMGIDDAEWADDINSLFSEIKEEQGNSICQTYVIDLMQRIANDQMQRSSESMLTDLLSRESPATVQLTIGDEISKIVKSKQISINNASSAYVQPLLNLKKMMTSSKAWPTGVDFFDEMTGGGVRTGRLWGFLAPPSGGKTTIALQLGMNWAKQSPEHNTVLFLYEQPPEGDITSRILCHTTGESVTKFRDVRIDQLSPEMLEKIANNSESFATRLHTFDFSKPGMGVRGLKDIEDCLREIGLLILKEDVDTDKVPPVFVIIDWLIPMFQREMTALGEGALAVGMDLRGYGTKFMDEIKAFKNKYHVCIKINHQLNSKAGSSSATRAPAWSDAAEWSGFSWMLDDCFGIGNRTEEDIAILASVKARANARSQIFVKLDGEFCRFVDVNNEYMVSNGKMLKKSMQVVRGSSTNKMANKVLSKLVSNTAAEMSDQFSKE